MSISKIAGKAQTVLGLVYGRDLGVTLVHEHLTIDHVQANFAPPTDLAQKELMDQPLTMDMLHWIQHYRMHNKDNLRLSDEKAIIKEAMFFKNDGGNTIVEMSNMGINRNPKSLAHISRATGLNIIMGSGYYVHTCHPEDIDKKSQDDISQEIICDVIEGVDNTGIKSGIIGEIGCSWPLHPNEKKVVLAAAKAQRFTGAPINIHPGRGKNTVFELADILVKEKLIKGVGFAKIPLDEAYLFPEIMLMGTSINILPVVNFDGRPIGNGSPGPVSAGLSRLLWKDMTENQDLLTEINWE